MRVRPLAFPARLVLAVALLAGALATTTATAAAATVLEGRAVSGHDRPLPCVPVVVSRAVPGAARPVVVGRTTTARDGTFRVALHGTAGPLGAVTYVVAGRGAARLAAVLSPARAPDRVVVNELTTVAAGYALAQFTSPRGIAGKAPGLANAAAMAANLADARTGRASRVLTSAPNGRQTSTERTVHSLANLVTGCVRSARRCATLLRLATPPRGPAPRTTFDAVAAIARNPWQHVGALFAQARSAPHVYRPSLTSRGEPDAWTVALRFAGDGTTMSGPGNFAVDAQGNLWVLNNYVYSPDRTQSVCGSDLLLKFTPDGRYAPGSPYTGGGVSGAGFGITFDPTGNLWLGNYGFATPGCTTEPAHDSVSKFSPNGRPLSPPAGFTQGGISWPQGTVSDRRGTIWIANCGNDTVTRFPGGDPRKAQSIGDVGLHQPFDVVVDGKGRAYVTGVGSSTVALLDADGKPRPGSPVSGGGLNHPMGVAVDSTGHVWVANSGLLELPCPDAQPSFATRGGSLTLLDEQGRPARSKAFTGGGLTIPWGIAVDGDDNVWIANFGRQRLSQFCGTRTAACPPGKRTGSPISPASGYGFDGLVRNTGVAIDPSGNVWLTNNWKTIPLPANPGGYQIVAYVGAASPLRTPLIGPPQRP